MFGGVGEMSCSVVDAVNVDCLKLGQVRGGFDPNPLTLEVGGTWAILLDFTIKPARAQTRNLRISEPWGRTPKPQL